MADAFCKDHLPAVLRPGPAASLDRSEVLTRAVFSQRGQFKSERAFYRSATRHPREAFPGWPHRSPYNRRVRHHPSGIPAFFLRAIDLLAAGHAAHEAPGGTAVAVRNAERRGEGWLWGQAGLGWSNRPGWYEGFCVLASVPPGGVLAGFGFAPAGTKDQTAAEAFFAARADSTVPLPGVGRTAPQCDACGKGFEGAARHRHWAGCFGAHVLSAPKKSQRQSWPKALRRGLAGIRQIVGTVHEKLRAIFRLDCERPHARSGFHARRAATCALHNLCIWLNRQLGRPNLAFAGLIGW